MLPQKKFDTYKVRDEWEGRWPVLKLDDLAPVDGSLPVKLSYLISFTNYRRTQLARTLETLCRQDWKEFEVLICDDGSTQDMKTVFDTFRPYLRMRTYRLERAGFSGCVSRGVKHMLPEAMGEVVAFMQPEMMLVESASRYLYETHFLDKLRVDDVPLRLDKQPYQGDERRYVCLKNGFFDEGMQKTIDHVNWHSGLKNVETVRLFWQHHDGLGAMSNGDVLAKWEWPWWFIGSVRRDDPLLQDMPVFRGHASIDFWLINYRYLFGYVDICNLSNLMAYHQFHQSARVAPEGEADNVASLDAIRKQKGLK